MFQSHVASWIPICNKKNKTEGLFKIHTKMKSKETGNVSDQLRTAFQRLTTVSFQAFPLYISEMLSP